MNKKEDARLVEWRDGAGGRMGFGWLNPYLYYITERGICKPYGGDR